MKQETSIEEIAARVTVEIAKICGCSWESCTTTRNATKAAIVEALRNEREACAKVLEARADELQAEWDAPPSATNGFIEMTADTPAGYATCYCMNQLRKLATIIRGKEMETKPDQVQCADCLAWIDRDANHTCRQQVRRNKRAIRKGK